MNTENDVRQSMNSMYRYTRYIYDLTRKYFLLGRDHLIEHLGVKTGDHIIEVGCGTARNLILLAGEHPHGRFYGFDASDEMLKTAFKNLQGSRLERSIRLEQGFSQSFNPEQLFGLEKAPDKIIFSYTLSIIPPWRESIDHALELLAPGGEIHIVDFGSQEDLPKAFRKFLFWWLSKFHVYYKPEILDYLKQLSSQGKGTLTLRTLFKGYSWYAVFKKS
ncbi:MAG: class I SAM-dependent methyltransferase [Alphaproteobacteria bacterium]